MNKIKVENNIIDQHITNLNEDTYITYINSTITLDFNVNKPINIFENINNSKINTTYNLNNSCKINRFSINSSVETKINLDSENIKLDYFYSNINEDDNKYLIDINHNKKKTISNIINHGINLYDNELNYIINGKINKTSTEVICNQDSRIIVMNNNNCLIKPNLIVDNNDISANHSAYIGHFNKEDIFYLKARGINEINCINLLARSFLIGNMDISYIEKDLILKNINNYWR